MTDMSPAEYAEYAEWHPATRFIPTGRGWNAVQLRAVADRMEEGNEVAFLGTIQTYRRSS